MLKISPLFKKFTNLQVNNTKILRITNAKLPRYCFYMNTNIEGDFQICTSAPLTYLPQITKKQWRWKLPWYI